MELVLQPRMLQSLMHSFKVSQVVGKRLVKAVEVFQSIASVKG